MVQSTGSEAVASVAVLGVLIAGAVTMEQSTARMVPSVLAPLFSCPPD